MNYANFINQAEDYIEMHLDQAIKLDDVADHMHMSKFHFHRVFRKAATETFRQFVARIKLERSAVFLLISQGVSITEIAFRYGYSDASSYNRAFRRHWGMSPSEFRKSKKRQS